jgi:hypothetical protein
MSTKLKLYSKFLKKKLAAEAILEDLKPNVLIELKKFTDGQTVCDDVEYHITNSSSTKFADDVNEQIKAIKENAKQANKFTLEVKETFNAAIPKSVKEKVLLKITEYKNYFG